jgi:hypothetical protein
MKLTNPGKAKSLGETGKGTAAPVNPQSKLTFTKHEKYVITLNTAHE